jgi:short-subunit dehydrogenase
MNTPAVKPLAVVTGASSGIGFELARQCVKHGFDLVIAADRPLMKAARDLSVAGATVECVETDLAERAGVEELYQAINGRAVDALVANAGHGLGRAFLEQDFDAVEHVIDTNITGTLYLIRKVGADMRRANRGRILIVGSIAGLVPGSFNAVYNGTQAFIDSFSWALRNELKDTSVTVTCLMPGVTDTEFFARADMRDTMVGTLQNKADPAEVARLGFDAMMDGVGDVVTGMGNKLGAAAAHLTPAGVLAELHRRMAEPGSGKH